MTTLASTTEVEILSDVIGGDEADLPPEVARSVLCWKFSPRAVRRMNTLAGRNRRGTLTTVEAEELQTYLRVGTLVNLLQAKARVSLKQLDNASG